VPAEFYGLLFGAGILGIIGTNTLNTRLVPRYSMDSILVGGTSVAAVAGIVLATTAFTDWGGLWGLFVPLLLFVSVTGFIVPNSIAGAMVDFPDQAGAVSALVGALQYGTEIAGSGLVGAFADGTPWPMGGVIAVTGIGSMLCALLVVPRGRAMGRTAS
jgi:MFS transporter, DHA1 family, multidrug resistance protein